VHDDVVLIRTDAGQDAVFDDMNLDAARRRLLRLVNGYTSLSGLTARLDPCGDWKAAAAALLDRRLVRVQGARSDAEDGLSSIGGRMW
jgi:hypothetical protein